MITFKKYMIESVSVNDIRKYTNKLNSIKGKMGKQEGLFCKKYFEKLKTVKNTKELEKLGREIDVFTNLILGKEAGDTPAYTSEIQKMIDDCK